MLTQNKQKVEPKIIFQAHVENIGWQEWKESGNIAGTEGKSLKIEAIKINLVNVDEKAHIKYKVHVENIGWTDYVQDAALAGTTGRNLKIEAIQIELIGLENYTVEYKAHVCNKGWQQWAKSGMICGTINQNLRLEALQLRIIKASNTIVPSVSYSTHIQNIGWQDYKTNGETSGLENGKIEALKIALSNTNANVKYKTHVENEGWLGEVRNNEISGTTGRSQAVECTQIQLENLNGYCIEYRVYINGQGWQEWKHDGLRSRNNRKKFKNRSNSNKVKCRYISTNRLE